VRKLRQGYDNDTNEHVIWLEYRVRVNPGDPRLGKPGISEERTHPDVR